MSEPKRIPLTADEGKEHDDISQRERAIQDVFTSFVAATTQEYATVQSRRQKLWRDLLVKYSLDSAKQHTIQTGPTGAFLEEIPVEVEDSILDVPQRPN